jgi:hypothetical protein
MNPRESCLICSEDPVKESDVFHDPYSFSYICDRCGHLYLTEEAAVKIYKLEPADKIKLGIGLRNKFENRDRIKYTKPFNAMEIELLVKGYRFEYEKRVCISILNKQYELPTVTGTCK